MSTTYRLIACGVAACLVAAGALRADRAPPQEAAPAERGRAALLGRPFAAPVVSRGGYDALWKVWGLKDRPADFDAAVRERYGLHEAPYPNAGLPMGLRAAQGRKGPGVAVDCMLCHGGSLFGRSYVGLPNTALDLAGLFADLAAADGVPNFAPFHFSNVRGTTESTATAVFLIAFRDDDLSVRWLPKRLGPIPDQSCEDAPAWWLLKRKRTMYHNGQIDARAVRPLMSFMLSPSTSAATFHALEPVFADIRAYLQTVEAPRYPFPIDEGLAAEGKPVFEANCASCHGAYGPGGAYPNKVVPLGKIGTDPSLVRGLTPRVEAHFASNWLSVEPGPDGRPYPLRYNEGYQAPPLDGVWATAPYLHNGSVPTLWAVLKSADRPARFTRSFGTAVEDYDAERVGWRTTPVGEEPPGRSPRDARRTYDTTKPGRSNAGHTYGDKLTDAERRAVVEYLKTL